MVVKKKRGNIANAAKTVQQDASKNTKTSVIKDQQLEKQCSILQEKCTIDKKDKKYIEKPLELGEFRAVRKTDFE